MMHKCSDCDKVYWNPNSLTRHIKTHKAKRESHTCDVCQVAFYRRDILQRHMKVHDQASIDDHDDATRANAAPGDGTVQGRKRCHTACNRCRQMRLKCNDQRPCARCTKASVPCQERAGRRRRISHLSGSTPTGNIVESSHDVASNSELLLAPDPISEEHAPPADMTTASPDAIDTAPICSSDPSVIPLDVSVSDASMVDLNGITWPWLHENMFLSDSWDYLQDAVAMPSDHNTPYPSMLPLTDQSPTFGLIQNFPSISTEIAAADDALAHEQDKYAAAGIASGSKVDVVNSLVLIASQGAKSSKQVTDEFWALASAKLVDVFQLGSRRERPKSHHLDTYIHAYWKHFNPLWPLFTQQNFETTTLHPLLYLTLTSIGAMYLGTPDHDYGSAMHVAVRDALLQVFELKSPDDDHVWLAQSRLLVQVSALYFGQPRAFSYAQHLGALLVTQSRRMALFTPSYYRSRMRQFNDLRGLEQDEDRLNIWLMLEARRRLAFGLFRGETFTSVLLNSKPLITLDEIDIDFPWCDIVWRGPRIPPSDALRHIDQDLTLGRNISASMFYDILMDGKETLPPLEPPNHELLLFGLQWPIWRVSRRHLRSYTYADVVQEPQAQSDDAAFERIQATFPINSKDTGTTTAPRARRKSSINHEVQSLDIARREMHDLGTERQRLLLALAKWEASLPVIKSFARNEVDRCYILSSLILYHIGFIRLYAPIEDLHQVQYHLADSRTPEDEALESISQWLQTPSADISVAHVESMAGLIQQELTRAEFSRSKFNLLAFLGLHHGSTLIWAYQSVPQRGTDQLETAHGPQRDDSPHDGLFLKRLIEYFEKISIARWPSFREAAKLLLDNRLDIPA